MGVKPEERTALGLLVLIFGVAEAGRGLGVNASDALFFLRFGVDQLPWMYILLGGLTFLAMIFYSAGIGRFRWKFTQGLYVAGPVALILQRVLVSTGNDLIYPVLWLTVQILAWVLVISAWNLASETFDTRQAKRLFSLLTSASIAGSALGNAVTGPLARLLGTENIFLIYAGLLLAVSVAVRQVVRSFPPAGAIGETVHGPMDSLLTGVRELGKSRLLRLIVLSSVFFSILFFSVWFPFNQSVTRNFSEEASLAGFLGAFTSVAMLSTLLLSLVSNRIYARFGIVNVILLVPLIYLSGFAMWMIEFSLITAVAFRFVQLVWINGAGWTAWNALYNVFHAGRREQLRAFQVGVPTQLGTVLSGVLLLMGQRGMASQIIFVLGGAAALLLGVLCWRMRSAYGEALLSAIRDGLVEVFTGTTTGLARLPRDSQARQSVIDALDDADANVRRIAAEVLADLPPMPVERDRLFRALKDPSPLVRSAVTDTLRQRKYQGSLERIRPLHRDPSPAVRLAAVRALAAFPDGVEGGWLKHALADENPGVRAEAIAHLYQRGEHGQAIKRARELIRSGGVEAASAILKVASRGDLRMPLEDVIRLSEHPSGALRGQAVQTMSAYESREVEHLLLARLEDEDKRVREAAAQVLHERIISPAPLFDKLTDRRLFVQQAALQAVNKEAEHAAQTLVDWCLDEINELAELHRYVLGFDQAIKADPAPEIEFLADLVERRRDESVDLVLMALVKLDSQGSMTVINRGIKSSQRGMRSRALEALEAYADKEFVRRLMPVLETGASEAPQLELEQVLEDLTDNRDPWIRGLAILCRARQLRGALGDLQSVAQEDPSPVIQEIVEQELQFSGDAMNETLDTLSTMERVMYLRKVPIFDALSAEELHRIADTAVEQLIPEGNYLCRQGATEDQLYLIVDGQVVISKQIDGQEKELFRRGPGHPVGELAILAERPRSASVRAVEGEVRALVIEGESFQAILHERPAVSIAMLANLARRLGDMT